MRSQNNNDNQSNKLIKHSAAIHISNTINLTERKIYNLLIKNAYSNIRNNKNIHYINISTLLKELGYENSRNYEFIEEAAKKLVNTSITFNILGKDKKRKWQGTFALLADAVPDEGVIKYSFPATIVSAYANPNIYATLDLSFQKVLSSKYSLAMWEFCTEQIDSKKTDYVKTEVFSLFELRGLLGAQEKTHEEFKFFNNKVLKPCLEEVNSTTDLNIKAFVRKERRKVAGIYFEIQRNHNINNEQIALLDEEPNIMKVIKKTFEEQDIEHWSQVLGLSRKVIENFLKEHSMDEVEKVFQIIEEKIKNGFVINNIAGYIWKLLDKGVAEVVSSEQVREESKQQGIFTKESKAYQNNHLLQEFFIKAKHAYGEGIYKSWLLHLSLLEYNNDFVKFSVPNNFVKEWIEVNYKEKLLEIWQSVFKCSNAITIIVSKDNVAAATPHAVNG